jgi:hypothetical protein
VGIPESIAEAARIYSMMNIWNNPIATDENKQLFRDNLKMYQHQLDLIVQDYVRYAPNSIRST